MMATHHAMQQRLERAEVRGLRRYLPPLAMPQKPVIDFSSGDYLGLARHPELHEQLSAQLAALQDLPLGATGSRLLSGNHQHLEELEEFLQGFHRVESALLFNSGYAANLSLFSSLPRDEVQIFYDEQIHASTKDGIALARLTAQPFRHNNLEHLEQRLKNSRYEIYVSVEALYSMDGSMAPLRDLVALCERYQAHLIVDEAHSVGVYGSSDQPGAGLVQALSLETKIFARVVTFGKALGYQGAAVLGPSWLKDYLLNFAHGQIYSTAMALPTALAIKNAYARLADEQPRLQLQQNIRCFQEQIQQLDSVTFLDSRTAIQGVFIPMPQITTSAKKLRNQGFDIKAIRSPTVRRGSERLRICLHSFNTETEIAALIAHLCALKETTA